MAGRAYETGLNEDVPNICQGACAPLADRRHDAPDSLSQRSRLGEPLDDGCHEQDYGDEAGDGGENRAGTRPQSPIELLPSTAYEHHFELLPPVLAQMTSEQ